MSEQSCRGQVAERSGGFCEVRFTATGICRGMGESMHHRRKRSQGGEWVPSNILHVCGHGTIGCHGYIEANPATARRLGLWLFAGQEPSTTPVKLQFRGITGWFILDDTGSLRWLSQRALELIRSSA